MPISIFRAILDVDLRLRQRLHDLHGLQAQADELADQARDVVWGVGAVGVVDDGSGGVGFDAVLVDDSFEGGAAAEAVGEGGGGDAICVGPRECDRGGRCEAEYVVTVGDVVEGVGE